LEVNDRVSINDILILLFVLRRISKSLREQALSSIPSISNGGSDISGIQRVGSSSAKRTRQDEEFEDTEENQNRNRDDNDRANDIKARPSKRGKLDGTKSFFSKFPNNRSPENDYLDALKFVRVNLTNLKYVKGSFAFHFLHTCRG
jgi:hypothetical protein